MDNLTILNIGKCALKQLLSFSENKKMPVQKFGNFSFFIEGENYNYSYEYLYGNIYHIDSYDFSTAIQKKYR